MKDFIEKTSYDTRKWYRGIKEKKDGMVHIDDFISEDDAVKCEALTISNMVEDYAYFIHEEKHVEENIGAFIERLKEEVIDMKIYRTR